MVLYELTPEKISCDFQSSDPSMSFREDSYRQFQMSLDSWYSCPCVISSSWVWAGFLVSFLMRRIWQKCRDVSSKVRLEVLFLCFSCLLPQISYRERQEEAKWRAQVRAWKHICSQWSTEMAANSATPQIHNCSHQGNQQPELLSQTVSEFLTHRNCEIMNVHFSQLLSFGINHFQQEVTRTIQF